MTKTEVVFIPTPGMGHLLSTVELAKLIVQTNDTISIFIIIYHLPMIEPAKLQTYIDSQSNVIDPDRIAFVTLPPVSNLPALSHPRFFELIVELQKPLVQETIACRETKPAAFVLDLMNVSMIDVANELHLPSYIYFTSEASFLVSLFHFQALADGLGLEDITSLVPDMGTVLDVPGFRNPVPGNVLPWVFLDRETAWPSLILDLPRRFREAKGILVNTFIELECFAIQALTELDKVPTVFPVGPLLALDARGDSKLSNEEDDLIDWLDKQPRSSVVFLCFGSMGCFNEDQIKEMANAIDRSGHRFLWSLRKPKQADDRMMPSENEIFYEALPDGFLDRTAQRGKIIAWAPQVTILGHEAVGGFVTHCGWNSTLESIWFGVPMATWPVYSEQQLNAFTLVKELELADEISLRFRWDFKKNKGNYLVTADEVENGIKKLMSMDIEMRRKVREISEKSKQALRGDGGSSHNFLTRFIEEITQKSEL